jgi:23S rRNA (uracil1939-C5)-methyltransferase
MSSPPYFTIDIHALSHEGRGIGNVNGITTFVDGALPDEQVICQITKKHRRYLEAKPIEFLKTSSERITPACPHFGICGGCSLQHLNPENQIQFKQKTLLEQLQLFGKVTAKNILPPLVGQVWGYRRKARLGVRYVKKKEQLFIGFREKGTPFLTNINSCKVLHPKIGNAIIELNHLVASLSQFENIPQIEVAIGDNEAALVFRHLTELPADDLAKLSAFGVAHQFSIYLQPNGSAPITKLTPNDSCELLTYALPDFQLELAFHPLDFIQINGEINQSLIKLALNLLDPQANETILDLFCGLGNFTLPLARFAKRVIGVEGCEKMVMRAKQNAERNSIHNTEFYAANLTAITPQTTWLQNSYEKILLDPPRTGAIEIIPLLASLSAKKIVYISCNPATLARDAHMLTQQFGYTLKVTGVVNMFPHTSHVEAIAVFEK